MYVLVLAFCIVNGYCEASAGMNPYPTKQACEDQAPLLIEAYLEYKGVPEDLVIFKDYMCVSFGEPA